MTEVMVDLSNSSFSVPLIEKNSPLAYSIINEVHWNDKVAKHAGVETVKIHNEVWVHFRREGTSEEIS